MKCPNCGSLQVRVTITRTTEKQEAIYRRRLCHDCGTRFATLEVVYPGDRKVDKRTTKRMYEVDLEVLDTYAAAHENDRTGSVEKDVAMALKKLLPTLKGLEPMFFLPVYPRKEKEK